MTRFPNAKKLVGYAGLGARVHASGLTHTTGGITKTGRRELRAAMVTAAQHAVKSSAHWKAQYEHLAARIGKKKAIVAVARKLLIVVWHVLTDACADRFAEPEKVAAAFHAYAYKVGVRNLPYRQTALEFTRSQLDRLRLGQELERIRWGSKNPKLPRSHLTE